MRMTSLVVELVNVVLLAMAVAMAVAVAASSGVKSESGIASSFQDLLLFQVCGFPCITRFPNSFGAGERYTQGIDFLCDGQANTVLAMAATATTSLEVVLLIMLVIVQEQVLSFRMCGVP